MTRKRPVYTEEYRRKIIELHQSGRAVSSLACDFEPCAATIQSWIDKDKAQNEPGSLFQTERQELIELRKQKTD